MYDIYYAHHQYKYKSIEEAYELDLIRRYFHGIIELSVTFTCNNSYSI